MKCCYHPGYEVPVSATHPFPASKFFLLKEKLLDEGVLSDSDLLQPGAIDVDTAALVHSREYLHRLQHSALTALEVRRLGLPWSAALWQRSLLACGGTLLASKTALCDGMAANLAGGTHHAFADHGEGFCVLNDVAIAIAKLREEHAIARAVVIDLDVHQGNGTAAIFEHDAAVFTFSMHGERNYPTQKMRSDLDLALDSGTGDEHYLQVLKLHLPQVLQRARADLACYVAGVDVAAGDRYGKLNLSDAGIGRRDAYVIDVVRRAGVPLVIVLGGGYATTRERTAELHAQLFRAAAAFENRRIGTSRGFLS